MNRYSMRPTSEKQFETLLAQALDGRKDALKIVLRSDNIRLPQYRFIHPALLRRFQMAFPDETLTDEERSILHQATAWMATLEYEFSQLISLFHAHHFPCIPLKGIDTAFRFFEEPTDRLTTDIDLLVREEDVEKVCSILISNGWTWAYDPSERYLNYIRDEGYNYQFVNSDRILLEIHFRLWGFVRKEFTYFLWECAYKDKDNEVLYRIPSYLAYLISATHLWLSPPTRFFHYLWELHRISRFIHRNELSELIHIVEREGLQLPVALASALASTLWPENRMVSGIMKACHALCSWSERWIYKAGLRFYEQRFFRNLMYLVRLMNKRPSRMGWRGIYRKLWPHPGIIDVSTSPHHPWVWRRVEYYWRMRG